MGRGRSLFRGVAPRFALDLRGAGVSTPVAWVFGVVLGLWIAILLGALLGGASSSETGPPSIVWYSNHLEGAIELNQVERTLRAASSEHGNSAGVVPEQPFWILVETRGHGDASTTLELRLLRAKKASFFLRTPSGEWVDVGWRHRKGGIAIDLPTSHAGLHTTVGHIDPVVVSGLVARLWDTSAFRGAAQSFDRIGGALLGAMLLLSAVSLLVSIRNRDVVYLLFSFWTLVTMRLAAINAGFDLTWLGFPVESSATPALLRVTLALNPIANGVLFIALFDKVIRHLPHTEFFRPLLLAFGALAVVAPMLSHETFLAIFWPSTAIAVPYFLYLILMVVRADGSRSTLFYGLAWASPLVAALVDILAKSGLGGFPFSAIQLGILVGALLNAVAMAERVREDRLQRSRARDREIHALRELRRTYDGVPQALFSSDSDGRIVNFNAAFAREFGVTQETVAGFPEMTWGSLFAGESTSNPESFNEIYLDALSNGTVSYTLEVNSVHGLRHYELQGAVEENLFRGILEDITEKRRYEAQLRFLAEHDHRTGLLNLTAFVSLTESLAKIASAKRRLLAVVDIARFSSLNSVFGLSAGDLILREAAARLRAAVNETDLVARGVGAEFVILLAPDVDIAPRDRLQRILYEVTSRPLSIASQVIAIKANAGAVELTDGKNVPDALHLAKAAVAEAKRRTYQGGGVMLADQAFIESVEAESVLASRLRTKGFDDLLFLVAQPIINLSNPDAEKQFEVLVRMKDEDGKTIPPGSFIGAAERHGLISLIDAWVLRKTLEAVDPYLGSGERLQYAAINVSGASLNDLSYRENALRLLREYPSAAQHVCFEITEGVALTDLSRTRGFIRDVKAFGCRVALDDFGAGYTSFNYLCELPADVLKLDGQFVKGLARNTAHLAVVRAIRDLASELKMVCVAEWVEDLEVVRAVRELDIQFGQGYGLCRPRDLDAILSRASGEALFEDPSVYRYLARQRGRQFTVALRQEASE